MPRKRYYNLDNVENKKTFKDFLRWRKERKNAPKKDFTIQIPFIEHPQTDFLQNNKSKSTITWVGHATFLIQIAGMNILTDPVWAPKMGFQSRLTKPGLPIEELPAIDAVVISHGHYDHLDFPTLKQLKGDPVYLVPEGLMRLFHKKGFKNTLELKWWNKEVVNNIEFTFLPAQHWTRRGPLDMNTSHWGGWLIRNKEKGTNQESIYFVGDTGYFSGFKEIGDKYEIQYVLMPIGAYDPEWFMKVSHINPEDAVKAFLELKAKYFIPMHYGTYHLADDTGPEAIERLTKEWKKQELGKDRLNILKLGETHQMGEIK